MKNDNLLECKTLHNMVRKEDKELDKVKRKRRWRSRRKEKEEAEEGEGIGDEGREKRVGG